MRHSIVLALALVARAARADDIPDYDTTLHWQIEPAVRFGTARLDGQGGGTVGGAVDAGLRYGRFMLAADLSEISVTSTTGVAIDSAHGGGAVAAPGSDGNLDRVAATARVYFARYVDSDIAVTDVWVSAGVGREWFTWDTGGVLTRNDVQLGVGGMLGLHGSRWHANEHRWWGGFGVALYVVYANRVDGIQPIACGGPCDMATRPSRDDRSVFFDMTFPFGK